MGANALLRAADGLPWLFPSPQDVQEDQPQPPQNTPLPDGPVAATSTPQPVPAAGSQAEKAVPNKSLLDWLRQQSDYTLDVPGFGTVRVAFGGVCVSLSALSVAFSAVFFFFLWLLSSSGLPWSVSKLTLFPCTMACGVRQGCVTFLGGGHGSLCCNKSLLLSCVLLPQGLSSSSSPGHPAAQ